MRSVLMLGAMVVSLATGWIVGLTEREVMTTGPHPQVQAAPTIEQIQSLAQLVTESVTVSDVIESQLAGRTGSIRAVVIVRGSVLIATDLSRARFEAIDEVTHLALLLLPEPKVFKAAVDQEHTRVFAVTESGLWRITPDDGSTKSVLLERCFCDAQRLVAAAGAAAPLQDRARQQAETTIINFMHAIGWTVTVKWLPN